MHKLNGCNSQMLSRITGNDICTEARSTTSSFDVVKHIRVRRLCGWGRFSESIRADCFSKSWRRNTPCRAQATCSWTHHLTLTFKIFSINRTTKTSGNLRRRSSLLTYGESLYTLSSIAQHVVYLFSILFIYSRRVCQSPSVVSQSTSIHLFT